jgi:hypothetical protein
MAELGELRAAELPLVPGEVAGWRAWIVLSAGYREPRLRSLYYDVVWPTDRWLIAGEGPGAGDHGICAARDREQLVAMHRYGQRHHPRYVEGGEDGIAAIGKVALAGVIIPGERGYRAEKARPLHILLPYVAWDLVEPLRRAYRVPVGLADVLVNPPEVQRGHRP